MVAYEWPGCRNQAKQNLVGLKEAHTLLRVMLQLSPQNLTICSTSCIVSYNLMSMQQLLRRGHAKRNIHVLLDYV